MSRRTSASLVFPTLLGALSASASAQGLDVAIVAAATTDINNCRFTDPQAFLMATGQFNTVDVINAQAAVPALADLTPYDAIITWSNSGYSDPVATGDVFADYVDAGGGVVVCTFALGANGSTLFLQGRWVPTYELVEVQIGQTTGAAVLGTVHDPGHPIMAGVSTFSGGTSSYRPTTTALRPGATSIADWDDGRVLVAVGTNPRRADVTLYPPSSSCRADFWDVSTDGALLLANAITYTAGGGLGSSYCSPAAANSTGLPGAMAATGSSVVAANNLVLMANDLPLSSFGFFITSQTQAFIANPNGSQGNLCLGGAIGRYVGPGQIQNSGATGTISLAIDLTQHPTPTGLIAVMPGEVWNFQLWHRDLVAGQVESNFTDGLELMFL